MFGHFLCDECHNEWQSGYAWDGAGQECRLCRVMILPHSLKPLKFNSSSGKGQPHREDLCEMCKQLGQSCKSYVPTSDDIAMMDEIPLEEDTQSVITTNSSIVGGGEDDDNDSTSGGDRTPINSDDDLNDEEVGNTDSVQKMFSKMKLK